MIEQAKGVVARTFGVGVDQAFDLLRKAARDRGAKLHDLATAVAAEPTKAESILSGGTSKHS